MIELPKGTYVPFFRRRSSLSLRAKGALRSARAAMDLRTVSGYASAIKDLDAVLAETPNDSLGLALKAEALASQAIHGARPRPNLESARDHARRSIECEEPVWQAWLAYALVQQSLEWNWPAAEESYRKALDLSGGDAAMHVWYTVFLVSRGRPKEAAQHLERAVDHYGYGNAACMGDLSMLLILAREYDAADVTITTALEVAPGYYQHHLHRSILLEARGDPAGALRALDAAPLPLMERPVTWGLRSLFSGLSGAPAVARRRIKWLETIGRTGRYIPQSQLAACWIGAGVADKAVHSLERAAEDREPIAACFWAYPMTRHLHHHHGFLSLMDDIGLIRY